MIFCDFFLRRCFFFERLADTRRYFVHAFLKEFFIWGWWFSIWVSHYHTWFYLVPPVLCASWSK